MLLVADRIAPDTRDQALPRCCWRLPWRR